VVAAGADTEAAAGATAVEAVVVAMVAAGAMVVSAEATSNFSKAVAATGAFLFIGGFCG
jgi:hypothetical protein